MLNRALAAVTLALLSLALVSPTHKLGDTAVYGDAYLWGESSIRVHQATTIAWFVDRWEVAQHALFALAAIACIVVLISGRCLALAALALAALAALATQRAVTGDGISLPFFLMHIAWTLAITVASLRR